MKSLNASPLEVACFILFVGYLVFQPDTPQLVAPFIDTTMGVVTIIIFTVYLFFTVHPVLGVLGIFVAYEIIRRTSTKVTPLFEYTHEQPNKDAELKRMNPVVEQSLEEEVVAKMAPIGSRVPEISAKPMVEKIHNASLW